MCAHCGASRRPPLLSELSPIARLARDGVRVRYARFLLQFSADRTGNDLTSHAKRSLP